MDSDLAALPSHSGDWTLRQDMELRQCMKRLADSVIQQTIRLEETQEKLSQKAELLTVDLENCYNKLALVKDERLLDERILESPLGARNKRKGIGPIGTAEAKKKVDRKQRAIATIETALQSGLKLVDSQIHQGEEACIAPGSERPMKGGAMPARKPLPSLIGSEEFYSEIHQQQQQQAHAVGVATPSAVTRGSGNSREPRRPLHGDSTPPSKEYGKKQEELNPTARPSATNDSGTLRGAIPTEAERRAKGPQLQAATTSPSPLPSHLPPPGSIVTTAPVITSSTPLTQQLDQQTERKKTTSNNLNVHSGIGPSITRVESTGKKKRSKGLFDEDSSLSEEEKVDSSSRAPAPSTLPKGESSAPVPRVLMANQQLPPVRMREESGIKGEKGPPIAGTTSQAAASKPVLKSFDTSFSNRLSAAIMRGPAPREVSSASQHPTQRPVSSPGQAENSEPSSATSSTENQAGGVHRHSTISHNEDMGPTSVAARIAQIGVRIPAGVRPPITGRRPQQQRGQWEEDGVVNGAAATEAPPQATIDVSVVKGRPGGPRARRAPTALNRAAQAGQQPITSQEEAPMPRRSTNKEGGAKEHVLGLAPQEETESSRRAEAVCPPPATTPKFSTTPITRPDPKRANSPPSPLSHPFSGQQSIVLPTKPSGDKSPVVPFTKSWDSTSVQKGNSRATLSTTKAPRYSIFDSSSSDEEALSGRPSTTSKSKPQIAVPQQRVKSENPVQPQPKTATSTAIGEAKQAEMAVKKVRKSLFDSSSDSE